jgi:hypothetical protein
MGAQSWILMTFLKEVEARRQSIKANSDSMNTSKAAERQIQESSGVPFDKIKEFFHLPKYSASKAVVDPSAIQNRLSFRNSETLCSALPTRTTTTRYHVVSGQAIEAHPCSN